LRLKLLMDYLVCYNNARERLVMRGWKNFHQYKQIVSVHPNRTRYCFYRTKSFLKIIGRLCVIAGIYEAALRVEEHLHLQYDLKQKLQACRV